KSFLRHNDRPLPTDRNVMLTETLTETRKLLSDNGRADMVSIVDRLKSRQPNSVGFILNSANHSDRTFDLPQSVQDAWDTMAPLVELALTLEKLNDRSSAEA